MSYFSLLFVFHFPFFQEKKKTCFSFAVIYQKTVLADVCVLCHWALSLDQRTEGEPTDFASVGQFRIAASLILQYYLISSCCLLIYSSSPFPATPLALLISFKEERSVLAV